jgi:predicted nuclease of predicted toxin-antitoxin system
VHITASPAIRPALDAQIAATTLTHDLIVVTRDASRHELTGAKIGNPFCGQFELVFITTRFREFSGTHDDIAAWRRRC